MNKKIYRSAATFITVSIMAAIFYFSSRTGVESERMSGAVRAVFESALSGIFGAGAFGGALEFIIRKSAHLFLYFCLGLSVSYTIDGCAPRRRVFLLTVALCAFYAVTDEFHQHFVPGRSPELRDVLIDAAGSAVGALAFTLKKRRKKSLEIIIPKPEIKS